MGKTDFSQRKLTFPLTDFSLLEDLIHSIREFKESENVDICVLDAGLEPDQIEKISASVNNIKKADWDIEIPFHKKRKEWLKSQVSRAFLHRLRSHRE